MPSEDDYINARENLTLIDNRVDIVLTHTCPTDFLDETLGDGEKAEANELTDFLQEVYESCEFEH